MQITSRRLTKAFCGTGPLHSCGSEPWKFIFNACTIHRWIVKTAYKRSHDNLHTINSRIHIRAFTYTLASYMSCCMYLGGAWARATALAHVICMVCKILLRSIIYIFNILGIRRQVYAYGTCELSSFDSSDKMDISTRPTCLFIIVRGSLSFCIFASRIQPGAAAAGSVNLPQSVYMKGV
jgi:hypothetical protein